MQNIMMFYKAFTAMALQTLENASHGGFGSKGQIPYFGTGKSRTFKKNLRKLKAQQCKRAHLRSLRG